MKKMMRNILLKENKCNKWNLYETHDDWSFGVRCADSKPQYVLQHIFGKRKPMWNTQTLA